MVYSVNLATVRKAHQIWTTLFPAIKTYYAVKCCPDPMVVQTLFRCGSAFDCASPAEVNLVFDEAPGADIIYANPCKSPEDMNYVFERGVRRTTFDSVCEIQKNLNVGFDLVLRIKADDPFARCPMGNKFGAQEEEWDELARTAQELGMPIVGVSFHVGSFAQTPNAYSEAIAKARRAFSKLEEYGHNPELLDIGGGFSSKTILPASIEINEAIKDYGFENCELIAEPGRFMVEHAIDLYTTVIGVKKDSVTIDDSLYGAFNCIVMDHAKPTPRQLPGAVRKMTVFGCTCDGSDIIGHDIDVSDKVKVGDSIVWSRMGAYTLAATTQFNGIPFHARERIYIDFC